MATKEPGLLAKAEANVMRADIVTQKGKVWTLQSASSVQLLALCISGLTLLLVFGAWGHTQKRAE